MSEFAIVMDYERRPSSKVTARDRQPFNQGAYFGRMERFKARRNSARDGAVTSAPQHLDARLLEEGEAEIVRGDDEALQMTASSLWRRNWKNSTPSRRRRFIISGLRIISPTIEAIFDGRK